MNVNHFCVLHLLPKSRIKVLNTDVKLRNRHFIYCSAGTRGITALKACPT